LCNLYRKILSGSTVVDGVPVSPFRNDPAYQLSVNSGTPRGMNYTPGQVGVLLSIFNWAFTFSLLAAGPLTGAFDGNPCDGVVAKPPRAAPHGGTLNLADPTVLPRFLHMSLAMVAVAALFLGASTALLDPERPPFDLALARRVGLRTFAFLTLAQLAVGPTVLLLQRPSIRAMLLGGSPRALGALVVAVPSAIAAVVTALRGVDPRTGRRGVAVPFALVHLTIAAMIVLRDQVRDLSLREVGFEVEATPVSVDLFAAALFTVSVVILVAALRAMFHWLRQGSRRGDPTPTPPQGGARIAVWRAQGLRRVRPPAGDTPPRAPRTALRGRAAHETECHGKCENTQPSCHWRAPTRSGRIEAPRSGAGQRRGRPQGSLNK
jgi:hypothetical protein